MRCKIQLQDDVAVRGSKRKPATLQLNIPVTGAGDHFVLLEPNDLTLPVRQCSSQCPRFDRIVSRIDAKNLERSEDKSRCMTDEKASAESEVHPLSRKVRTPWRVLPSALGSLSG